MKWINLKEKIPQIQSQILVLIDGRVAFVCKFNGEDFIDDGLDVDDVTHWCYLPEIPLNIKH